MGDPLRVWVVGQVTHDRFDGEVLAGGCALYGALIYRALGAEVQLSTSVGHDFRFDGELEHVAVSWQRRGRTTVFSNLYPEGQPRVQRVEVQAPPVVPHEPPAGLPVDLLHLAPVMGDVDLARWKAVAQGGVSAISVQGWIKRAGARVEDPKCHGFDPPARLVIPRPWEVSEGDLEGIGAACVSDEDLIGQGDLLDRLCRAIPIVALTHGHRGSEVIERGRSRRVGIYATRASDPTGAGDAYAAAFFHEVARGQDPVEAARMGAAVASIAIEGRGATRIARWGAAVERAARVPVDRKS